MALLQIYQISTGSSNPSGATQLLPGGAGVQVAGNTPVPGISAPRLEQWQREVTDTTAPTLINTNGTTPATPAASGKLLVLDALNSAFGANWKLNATVKQPLGQGQYGIVYTPGTVAEAGSTTSSVSGNISQGTRAVVVTQGPVKAFVQGTVGGTTVSAGMPLAADGAGNLTFAGSSPAVGTVLAVLTDASVASSVSIPVLSNIYVTNY